jgi:hypothetical protein
MAVGMMAAVAEMTGAAGAATSREQVRLDLLDACVFDVWKKREVKDRIVDDCKCASARAAKAFSDEQVSVFDGRLRREDLPVWNEAIAACFKT